MYQLETRFARINSLMHLFNTPEYHIAAAGQRIVVRVLYNTPVLWSWMQVADDAPILFAVGCTRFHHNIDTSQPGKIIDRAKHKSKGMPDN